MRNCPLCNPPPKSMTELSAIYDLAAVELSKAIVNNETKEVIDFWENKMAEIDNEFKIRFSGA